MNMESCSSFSQPAKMHRKTKDRAKDMSADSIALNVYTFWAWFVYEWPVKAHFVIILSTAQEKYFLAHSLFWCQNDDKA